MVAEKPQFTEQTVYPSSDLRKPGTGYQMGELLRGGFGNEESYQPPLWATQPAYSVGQVQDFRQQAGGTSAPTGTFTDEGLPIHARLPNPFGAGANGQAAPPIGIEGVPMEVQQAFGMVPGDQWGGTMQANIGPFDFELATAPISLANMESWTREGFAALLTYYGLAGAYQRKPTDEFMQDTEYQGPDDLNFQQSVLKGYVEARKAIGDTAWGLIEGAQNEARKQDALFRLRQVRALLATGASPMLSTGEKGMGIGTQGLVSAFTTLITSPLTGDMDRYTIDGIIKQANARGVDPMSAIGELYDLPLDVVIAIASDPQAASDELLVGLSAGEDGRGLAFSQDALTNVAVEGGFMLAIAGLGLVGTKNVLGAAGAVGRIMAPTGVKSFAAGWGGAGLRGAGAGVARTAGWMSKKAVQFETLQTAAGWTTRGLEWGVKQAAVMLDNDEMVALMDNLMYENPWAYNPGLNLMDAFSLQPLRALKPLLKPGERAFHIGTPGTPGYLRTIDLTNRRVYQRPQTATGALDVDALLASKEALSDIEVIIAGERVKLPKDHPQAVLIEKVRVMQPDDLEPLLADLGWERGWIEQTFGDGNPYGLTYDHLRAFVIYGYGEVARMADGGPGRIYPGATPRDVSDSFFRQNTPEILEMFGTDLKGESSHLASAIRGQWWDLGDITDSNLAAQKARKYSEYMPLLAFENAKHWIIASEVINKALQRGRNVEGYVPGYSKSINRQYLQDFRAHILRRYPEASTLIPDDEVQRFRSRTGLVEAFDERLKTDKQWTQAELLELIRKIEEAGDDPANKRVIIHDPGGDGGVGGDVMLSTADENALPRSPLEWPDDAFHYHARALGIEQQYVHLIEQVKKAGGSNAQVPPALRAQLAERAELTFGRLDTLEPEEAWKVITDWYDEALDAARTRNLEGRVPLLEFRGVLDVLVSAGIGNEPLLYRAASAASRLAGEVMNRPLRRSDPDGAIARHRAATESALEVSKRILGHLQSPMRRARIVATTADGVPDYVATPETVGIVHRLAQLAVWAKENPGAVLISGAEARALVTDLKVHPLLKGSELARIDWTQAPEEIQALARVLNKEADYLESARRVADELVPFDEPEGAPPPTGARLDQAALEYEGWQNQTQALAGELVEAEQFLDSVRGRPSDELVELNERIEYSEDPVGLHDLLDNMEVAARTQEGAGLRRERSLLAQRRNELGGVEAQLRDAELEQLEAGGRAGDYEWHPVVKPNGNPTRLRVGRERATEELGAIAAAMHEETGLGYAIVKVQRDGRTVGYELQEGIRTIHAHEAPPARPSQAELEAAPAAGEEMPYAREAFEEYLASKPGLRTAEPGLRAAYAEVDGAYAKTMVPFIRDLRAAGDWDEGRTLLRQMLDDGNIEQADHDILLRQLTSNEGLLTRKDIEAGRLPSEEQGRIDAARAMRDDWGEGTEGGALREQVLEARAWEVNKVVTDATGETRYAFHGDEQVHIFDTFVDAYTARHFLKGSRARKKMALADIPKEQWDEVWNEAKAKFDDPPGGGAPIDPDVEAALDAVEDMIGRAIRRDTAPVPAGSIEKWMEGILVSVRERWDKAAADLNLYTKQGTLRKRLSAEQQKAVKEFYPRLMVAHALIDGLGDPMVHGILRRLNRQGTRELVDALAKEFPAEVPTKRGGDLLPGAVVRLLKERGEKLQTTAREMREAGESVAARPARAREMWEQGMAEGQIARELGLTYEGGLYPMQQVRKMLGAPEPQFPGVDEAVLAASKDWGIEPVFEARSSGLDDATITALVGERVRQYPDVPEGWEVDPRSDLILRRPRPEPKGEYEEAFDFIARDDTPPPEGERSLFGGYFDQAREHAEGKVLAEARANAERRLEGIRRAGAQGKTSSFPDPFDETKTVTGRYELVEAADLITDADEGFRPELQPRGRGERAASDAQITKLAEQYDPDLALRTESGGEGPPLIGTTTDEVLAGNGRTRAMRKMSPAKWAEYKAALAKRSDEFGLDPADVNRMEQPVLVRRVPDDYMTPKYAQGFNAKTGGMSAAEQAIAVARLIQPEDVNALQLGEKVELRTALKDPKRQEFVLRVLGDLTDAEKQKYIDAKGNVSDAGTQLIEQALLAKALGEDVNLVTRLIESPEEGARFRKGLEMALGQLVKGEANVDDKLGPWLADAYRAILDGMAAGKPLRDIQAEFQSVGMFADTAIARPPHIDALGAILTGLKSQTEVATFLRKYADITGEPTIGMFDEGAQPLPQRLNLAVDDINNTRSREAQLAGKQLAEHDELGKVPAADGKVHTQTEGPSGPVGNVEVRPDDPEPATTLETARRVGSDDPTDAVPDEHVVYRAQNEGEQALIEEIRAPMESETSAGLQALGLELMDLETDRQGFISWFFEMQAVINGTTSSPHNRGVVYAFIRALAGEQRVRWTDGRFDATTPAGGIGVAFVVDESIGKNAYRIAQRLRGAEDIEVKGQGTSLRPDDAVHTGTRPRGVRDDFAEQTGLDPTEEPPAVRDLNEATEGGAPVVVESADRVTQAAAQARARTGNRATENITILQHADDTRIAAAAEARVMRLEGKRSALEAEVVRREAQVAERAGVNEVDPGVVLADDLEQLYIRYVYDSLAGPRNTGIQPDGPRRIEDVLDTIRSLDYEQPSRPGSTMSAEELVMLREGLVQYLDAKLTERGVKSIDEMIEDGTLERRALTDSAEAADIQRRHVNRTRRRASEAGVDMPRRTRRVSDVDPDGGTEPVTRSPGEHEGLLKDLNNELGRKLYTTDEPLEGYAGIGYQLRHAPKRDSQRPTLYYTHELTEELARYDRVIPGLGAELDSGRLMTREAATDAAVAKGAAGVIEDKPNLLLRLFDTAFGPRAQKDIEVQTIRRFMDDILPKTVDEEAARKIGRGLINHLHRQMREHKTGPLPFNIYRRIGHLRTDLLERWSREYLDARFKAELPEGETFYANLVESTGSNTPVWDAYRRADNRIRAYFATQEGGVAQAVEWLYETPPVRKLAPYGQGLNVLYGMFRFFMDARWLAMDAIEAPTLLLGREGPDAVWAGLKAKTGRRQIELLFSEADTQAQLMKHYSWWMEMGDAGGYFRWRDSMLLTMVERQQHRGLVQHLEQMGRQDPVLARMIKDSGDTPLEYIKKLDRDWRIMAERGKELPEAEFRKMMQTYVDDGVIKPDQLDAMVKDGKARWVSHPELEAAIQYADDPRLRALYERQMVITQEAWNDAAALIFGQTNRSNFQRLLNSPLLYWPISYQIKATKWLFNMLFDRFAGFETGAAPAAIFDMIYTQYKDTLAQDEEFQDFLKTNRNVLFTAQMLLPITPWDIGVSLSPFTRSFLSMVMDEPEDAYQRNLFSFGPGYSYYNLTPRLLREVHEWETPVVSDIAERLRYIFPLQYTVPVKGEPGDTRNRQDQVLPAEAFEPPAPPEPTTRFGP